MYYGNKRVYNKQRGAKIGDETNNFLEFLDLNQHGYRMKLQGKNIPQERL